MVWDKQVHHVVLKYLLKEASTVFYSQAHTQPRTRTALHCTCLPPTTYLLEGLVRCLPYTVYVSPRLLAKGV